MRSRALVDVLHRESDADAAGAAVSIEGEGCDRGRRKEGAMFRVRATSFFTGFAVASGIAMFQLQRDVWGSHHILADEVEEYYSQLEKRIQQLERAAGDAAAASRPRPVGAEECD